MGYRLDLGVPTAETLRRTAREQIADAARRLAGDDDPVEAVHEARKDLKKARSLLRLARPALGPEAYRRRNGELRDIARSLSAARDADVMVETIDDLAERFAGRLPPGVFTVLRRRFADAAAAERPTIPDDVLERLDAAARGVDDWPLDDAGPKTLARGAVRAYERGRRELGRSLEAPRTEQLHEWRKRVKDHWYHVRLLEEAAPRTFCAVAADAHDLSGRLGDDHDLAVLAERLERPCGRASRDVLDVDDVLELIRERRTGLQEEALRLGRRLYAERPKAFGRRVRRYLELAREPHPA